MTKLTNNKSKVNKTIKTPQMTEKQVKFKFLGILFVLLAFAAAVSLIYYWQMSYQPVFDAFFPRPMHHAQKAAIYTNAELAFQFNYDKKNAIDTSGNQPNFFKHAAKSLVSVSIPQSLYPKTNFGSANLTVAVQSPGQEASCSASAQPIDINGTTFHFSQTSQGAAGTDYQTKIYRVFHSQDCFEVSLTIGIANIGNFEPGAVAEVDQNAIWMRLDQMLKTFKFTDSGPNFSNLPPNPVVNPPPPSPASNTFGILKGSVFIGPNCPVQRIDMPCPPSPGALASTQIIVYKGDGKTVVATANVQAQAQNGTYSINLQPGTYLADYKSDAGFKYGHTKQPVSISAGEATNLDFNIDTGIR